MLLIEPIVLLEDDNIIQCINCYLGIYPIIIEISNFKCYISA